MGDITVASTTDSQEDVNRAAGLEPDSKPPEAEEPKPAPEVPPEPAPAAEEPPAEEEPKEVKPSKGGFQHRIQQLARRNAELEDLVERQSQRLETALARLEAGRGVPEAVPPTQLEASPKPTLDKFRTYEEWVEAMTDWKADQKLIQYQRQVEEQAKVEAQRSEQQRLQQVFSDYNRSAAVFREEHQDWEQVVGQNVEILAAVQLAVFELGNGPEVAYYLGKHPEVCDRLMELSDLHAVMEVSRISDRLAGGTSRNGGSDSSVRPQSTAPPPLTPVAGSRTAGSSVPLDEMSYRDYRRIRDEQERNRYRRG